MAGIRPCFQPRPTRARLRSFVAVPLRLECKEERLGLRQPGQRQAELLGLIESEAEVLDEVGDEETGVKVAAHHPWGVVCDGEASRAAASLEV